jgi:hypothetical protein
MQANVTRNQIFQGLVALINPLVGTVITAADGRSTVNTMTVQSCVRNLIHWSKVDAAQQPSIWITSRTQIATTKPNLPTKWELQGAIWVYVRDESPNGPAAFMDDFLDKIEGMFKTSRNGAGKVTLGNLVHDCRINGSIDTDEGLLGPQAVAVIPVEIVTSN